MLGSMSIIHWIILGVVALLLFGGKNKISDIMGDVAKGIKSFKKGLSDEEAKPAPQAINDAATAPPAQASTATPDKTA